MKNENNMFIELDLGYYVDIIKSIPDNKGNEFEGFLCYGNKDNVIDVGVTKKYETPEDTVKEFKDIILPAYLKTLDNNPFKGLGTDKDIYNFVKEFLIEEQYTWGTTIDILEVLEVRGYNMPIVSNKGFSIKDYQAYLDIVNKVSLETIKHLKTYGFGADKNTSNTKDHTEGFKHKHCRNIIYTRYPWTSAHKMNKTVTSLINMCKRNFTAGQDLSGLLEHAPGIHDLIMKLKDALNTDAIKFESTATKGFYKVMAKFEKGLDVNKEELIEVFSKLRPVNYGKYVEDNN